MFGGAAGRRRWQVALRGPVVALVFLPNQRHGLRRHPEKARGEVAPGLDAALGIDQRRRGADADGLRRRAPAERAQAADQAGRLRTRGAGMRVRLVEHEKLERRAVEHLDIRLTREQQLELLDVGEQDARRLPLHLLARAALLRRVNRGRPPLRAGALERGDVFGPRGARAQPFTDHIGWAAGRLADVHTEGNAGAGQQLAQAAELILGQGVHRIDEHGHDPRRGALVAQLQAAADRRVEEALRLARAGTGRDQRRLPMRIGFRGIRVSYATCGRSPLSSAGRDANATVPPCPDHRRTAAPDGARRLEGGPCIRAPRCRARAAAR